MAARFLDRTEVLTLALQCHSEGRFNDAEVIYRRLHDADCRDAEVIYLMGVLHCDLGLYESACAFLKDALALAPVFPEAQIQLVLALTALADVNLSSGNLEQAQSFLEKALDLAPRDPRVLTGFGRVALLRDNAGAAEVWLEAALAQRPDDAEALKLLGLAQLQLEKAPL